MGYTIFKRMQRLQGGTEAVPSELPTPPLPPEAYQSPTVRSLIDQVRQGILPDEALDEIRKDPTSMRSLASYAGAALSAGTLLSGGEGGKLPEGEVSLPKTEVPLKWKDVSDRGIRIHQTPDGKYQIRMEFVGNWRGHTGKYKEMGWAISKKNNQGNFEDTGGAYGSLSDAKRFAAERAKEYGYDHIGYTVAERNAMSAAEQPQQSLETEPNADATISGGQTVEPPKYADAENWTEALNYVKDKYGGTQPLMDSFNKWLDSEGVKFKDPQLHAGQMQEFVRKIVEEPDDVTQFLPPPKYVRGTSVVRGYPPGHMLNFC